MSKSCAAGFYIELCAESIGFQQDLNKLVFEEWNKSHLSEIQTEVVLSYSVLLCPYAPCFPGAHTCCLLKHQELSIEDQDHQGSSWPCVEKCESIVCCALKCAISSSNQDSHSEEEDSETESESCESNCSKEDSSDKEN